MENTSFRWRELAYALVLGILIIFLAFTIVILWNGTLQNKELFLSIASFLLGTCITLYWLQVVYPPLARFLKKGGEFTRGDKFREMEEELERSREEIKKWSRELEDRVEERTRQLREADRKLMETQMELLRVEKLASLGRIAAGLAHQIRNPLGIMRNASFCLRKKLKGRIPGCQEQMEILESEVERVDRIVNSLLHFARASSSSRIGEVDVREVLEKALSRADKSGWLNSVKLETSLEDVPLVKADPDQLQEVFINIISNAAESMPQGGRLKVSCRQEEGLVEISFTDTGGGIEEEDLKKIFHPFFSTKSPDKGVGLGLAIADEIVRSFRGKIEVKSKVGEGSTFRVKIPVGEFSHL